MNKSPWAGTGPMAMAFRGPAGGARRPRALLLSAPVPIHEFERPEPLARVLLHDLDGLGVVLAVDVLGVVIEVGELPIAEPIVVVAPRRRIVRHVDLIRIRVDGVGVYGLRLDVLRAGLRLRVRVTADVDT